MSRKTYNRITKILKEPTLMVFAAAPGSGKTHMIKKLCEHMLITRKVSTGYIFTPTKFNGTYTDMLPDDRIMGGYSDNELRKIIRHQRDAAKKNKDGKPAPIFIVLDDLIAGPNWNGALMTHIVANYRHYNLRLFIVSQYIKKISTTVREVARIAIIWKQNTANAIDSVHDSWLPDVRNVSAYFDELDLKKYEALAVFTRADDYGPNKPSRSKVKAPP